MLVLHPRLLQEIQAGGQSLIITSVNTSASSSEKCSFLLPMEPSKGKNDTKGKRKMIESNTEDKKEDTRSYFTWNLEMERVLADVLRDQRNMGNKGDGAWKTVAYNTAASVLSIRFKVQIVGDNVKNRIKLWRTWYGIVSDILSQSGFDWDGTKYMITVDNENAWNEYVKSHEEAKRFRYKVIPNWDDIVDLCAKDRATGVGAETALDADEAMSKEANEEEETASTFIDLEEQNSATKKRGQSSTSINQSQRRKVGEKDGLIASLREVAESLNKFLQSTTKKTGGVDVQEVLNELERIPDLDQPQWFRAVNWLTANPNQLDVVKALPIDKKNGYILAFMT